MNEMKLGKNKATLTALNAVKAPKTDKKRLQMEIAPELHKLFQATCVNRDRKMANVLTDLMIDWLNENGVPANQYRPEK